jgi:hypothetical protein
LEQMKKRIWLAVLLGIIIGVTLGYTPYVSPTAAPQTQFLRQQTGQSNIVQASPQPSSDALSIFIALAAGLVIAIPAFAYAKRRSQ